MDKPVLHGIMAEFDSAEALVAATEKAYAAGYRRMDAYTPFPVEEVMHALHLPKSKVPLITLCAGAFGLAGAYVMQWWMSAVNFPLNIGGKPYNSIPSWIPIMFECTVLLAALAAVGGMIFLNDLPLPYHPVFNVDRFERASNDGFFLCIESDDPRFDEKKTREFLQGLAPREVHDVAD